MLANNGIGLAANQVGLDAKVFVFGDSKENSTICFNPTVLQYTEEKVEDVEGCLSFPNTYVKIKRPKEILARWYDENFQECVVKIEGYSAKVYLHELDHLLGITIKDRVSKLNGTWLRKKLASWRRHLRKLQNGVEVYELDKPVELVIKTKCPMKWKLIDRETGEEYIGQTPKEGQYHWSKIPNA